MKDFIEKNKLTHSSQCGLRRAHSPDQAILDIVETLQNTWMSIISRVVFPLT